MVQIDASILSKREHYHLLTRAVAPRPIAFVTSQSKEGVLNGAPFSYFTIVSAEPPLLMISVQRKDKKMKDTARHIIKSGECVIHIVDETNVEEINKTASALPTDESEVDTFDFTRVKSQRVKVDGVKEAQIRMECELDTHTVVGDESADLIVVRVVHYHLDDAIFDGAVIDDERLKPVARLGGQSYSKLGEMFELVRPK